VVAGGLLEVNDSTLAPLVEPIQRRLFLRLGKRRATQNGVCKMSSKFNVGLDDILEDESGGRTGARWLATALGVIFFTLSSITTYLFFSTYAPALGAWAGDANAPIVAGIMGVTCLDFAALAWGYVRAKAATTGAQMTIALSISALDLVLGLATSALYVVLSTTLSSGVYAADGSLSSFGFILNLAGVLVITLALVANFAAVYVFQNTSADVRSASASTTLSAIVHAGQVKADTARAKMIVQRTLADILDGLPDEADAAAAANRAGYFARTMRRGLPAGEPATPSAEHAPSANGASGGVNPTQRPNGR